MEWWKLTTRSVEQAKAKIDVNGSLKIGDKNRAQMEVKSPIKSPYFEVLHCQIKCKSLPNHFSRYTGGFFLCWKRLEADTKKRVYRISVSPRFYWSVRQDLNLRPLDPQFKDLPFYDL